jgi:hypothetical protein
LLTDEQVSEYVSSLRGMSATYGGFAMNEQYAQKPMAECQHDAFEAVASGLEKLNAHSAQEPQFVLLLMTQLGGSGHWGLTGIFHDHSALLAYLDGSLRNYTIEDVSEHELAIKSNGFRVHQVLRDLVVKTDHMDREIPFPPIRVG